MHCIKLEIIFLINRLCVCVFVGSGTIPLETLIFTGYNFYLGLPVIVMGAYDCDIPLYLIYKYPKLSYQTGKNSELLNYQNMIISSLWAFVIGLFVFILSIRVIGGSISLETNEMNGKSSFLMITGLGLIQPQTGYVAGIYAEGLLIYTVLVMTMTGKIICLTNTRTMLFWAMILLSLIGYILFISLYSLFSSTLFYGIIELTFNLPEFWLSIFGIPLIVCLIDELFYNFIKYYNPLSNDKLLNIYKNEINIANINNSSIILNK